MKTKHIIFLILLATVCNLVRAELPGPIEGGYLLPNGWRITPLGDSVETNDLIMNLLPTPDGKLMVALHSGYNPHGLVVIDIATQSAVQRIPLPTSWLGLAWGSKGEKLYVSGGNASRTRDKNPAPVYVFDYRNGRLSEKPVSYLHESIAEDRIYWSGLVHHPKRNLLFAANMTAGNIVVFDTEKGQLLGRIPVEVNPYDLVLTNDGSTLYCSNLASDSVSVIDTVTLRVKAAIRVGDNPNDMVLSKDDRLFVACSNDNTVAVIDTIKQRVMETIVTSLYERAPVGSTPNALALDQAGRTLYVANADNNNVCVVNVAEPGESVVMGFIPTGWYPSSLALDPDNKSLFIGNGKGLGSSSNIKGPHSPLASPDDEFVPSSKSTVHGSVNIMKTREYQKNLRSLTKQAYANCPYNDDQLVKARSYNGAPTIVPSTVGKESPIRHVIYIIKENRTYDHILGDLPQGNGDPRLTIFGREITPNHHAIAEQFVLLDNLYCDAEVSVDGHEWSNAAYATDFLEKLWPSEYGQMGVADRKTAAAVPGSGYIWNQCARKGLTYRSYGVFVDRRVSETQPVETRMPGLVGHVAPRYMCWDARDTENAAEFIREFDEYEKNYDNLDPEKRLPQFIVMSLPEDHTKGSLPGAPTIFAAVGSNDYGLGMIVERVSHSRYWPDTAIFVIEDDAQNGSDHVDARRTVGLVISPYVKRKYVDSTFYTTSSMLRTIELLLGLPPMSQYDAAANPMYASFTVEQNLTPFSKLEPNIDLNKVNAPTAWGAEESMKMDLSTFDRAPMFALNEIIWKNARGPDSEMPLPISRFVASSLK